MILVACFVVALAGVWLIAWFQGQPQAPLHRGPNSAGDQQEVATVTIGASVFNVDLAADDRTRARGLSGRRSLPADYGMLFLWRKARLRDFWMKDCLMDLDIAFIGPDRKIGTVYTMKAEPLDTPDDNLKHYPPASAMQFALEVAPGEFARRGIKVADEVTFSPAVEAAIRYAE